LGLYIYSQLMYPCCIYIYSIPLTLQKMVNLKVSFSVHILFRYISLFIGEIDTSDSLQIVFLNFWTYQNYPPIFHLI
jgi:hypothetical protein